MAEKNIILIGFMGVGKSLCSNVLGEMLGRAVVSTDQEVERRQGQTIPEIFETKGEAYFRELEAQVVQDLCAQTDQIIDTGGGVVLNKQNLDVLKSSGIVIWLQATPEEIWTNVNKVKRNRPLLDTDDPMTVIEQLLHERIPFYSQADVSIHSGTRPIDEVCEEIINAVKMAKGKG